MALKSKILIVKEMFHISKSQFYYYNSKVENQMLKFMSLVAELDQHHYETRYDPFPASSCEFFPNIFITSSPEMR